MNSAETNYCNFEINLNDTLHNRFLIFYEHSRLDNQNSSLWSSVNHNYSFRSIISIPIILGSNSEFIDIQSIHWKRIQVSEIRSEILYEKDMTRKFKNFQWKEIKNEFLEQLLPTELLKNNFIKTSQFYHGMNIVILKAEYLAVKKGNILIFDETDNRNDLKINVHDVKDQNQIINIMKPWDIIKDVKETLNLCENDVLVFYIKKHFDDY